MKLNKQSFQFAYVLLLSVATLFAQNVTGTVSDQDGNVLAGVQMLL